MSCECHLIIEYWGGSVSKRLNFPLPVGAEICTPVNREIIAIAKVVSVDYYFYDTESLQNEIAQCVATLEPCANDLPIESILFKLGFL